MKKAGLITPIMSSLICLANLATELDSLLDSGIGGGHTEMLQYITDNDLEIVEVEDDN